MTTAVLVPTGVVIVCCGDHRPGGCCDAVDCASCCPECPTCTAAQALTPTERTTEAARHRALLADLFEWAHEINRNPPRWEAPACPIS